jgi:glycosyltransferase involved in cell wall biosynthesis
MRTFAVLCVSLLLLRFTWSTRGNSVCLNMIVKNEATVIERCLRSVLSFVDFWIIVDTGSTDGTQNVIQQFMASKGIPGVLHDRSWVDFSWNRNEAIQLASPHCDYLFFIDADEYVMLRADFEFPLLTSDYYYAPIYYASVVYERIKLVSTRFHWSYVGVLHEVLSPPAAASYGSISGLVTVVTKDGARSKNVEKYREDVTILELALQSDLGNSRYWFYLAQSYRDAGNTLAAATAYRTRASMGGWQEEVFYSLLMLARLAEAQNASCNEVEDSYLRAFYYRPTRLEPLFSLSQYFRFAGRYADCYRVSKLACSLETSDKLFVEQWIYSFGLIFERSICSYYIEDFSGCIRDSIQVAATAGIPEEYRAQAEKNRQLATQQLRRVRAHCEA